MYTQHMGVMNIRDIPPELLKSAKVAAAKQGVTLKAFVIAALKAAIRAK